MAIPCSRSDVFSNRSLTVQEKNRIFLPVRPDRGTHNYGSNADSLWRVAAAIAREIEGSRDLGEQWMRHEAIEEFGGLTAADLIHVGQGHLVVGFLVDVLVGLRD